MFWGFFWGGVAHPSGSQGLNTLGFALRNHPGRAQGTLWIAGDQTWLGHVQSKVLPVAPSLRPHFGALLLRLSEFCTLLSSHSSLLIWVKLYQCHTLTLHVPSGVFGGCHQSEAVYCPWLCWPVVSPSTTHIEPCISFCEHLQSWVRCAQELHLWVGVIPGWSF